MRRIEPAVVVAVVLAACTPAPDGEPVVLEPEKVTYMYGARGEPGAGVKYTCRTNDQLGDCYMRLPAGGTAAWSITVTKSDYIGVRVDAPGASCWIRRGGREVNEDASAEDDPSVSGSRRGFAVCSDSVYGQGW